MLMLTTNGALGQTLEPRLELTDCRINAGPGFPGIKARCASFLRSLNPDAPDGETISLHVAVVPALSLEPATDPVVPIAGGPGQASTDFYASSFAAFESLRRDRDIVLVDQRGTGKSAPMTCDVDDSMLQGRFSPEQTLELTRECLAAMPHDPRFFTTSVAVRDLEALRVALGYEQFNLYGISYGTRVAQHFARRYPESTRSVILDGVVPPQIALGPAIATEAQRAISHIFDRCAEQTGCSERFPALPERFADLVDRLTQDPVELTLPNPISGQTETITYGGNELTGAVRLLSYHPTSIALLPLLIHEAAEGNYQPLAAQFLSIRDSFVKTLSVGMHNSVVCTEDAPFFAGEAISDQDLQATYLGPDVLGALDTMCEIWPAGVIDADFKEPLATDVPVLLLSGEVDPITPPGYAELAAVDLGNALLLTGKLQGHGLAPRGCTDSVMTEFVDIANPTGVDAGCFERQFAMPFFLDFSGPAP